MSERDVPPLDPELEALLDAEKRAEGPSADAMQRMLARAEIALRDPEGGSDPGGNDPGPGGPPSSPGAPPLGAKLGSILVALGVGLAAGVALHATFAEPVVVEHIVERRVEVPVERDADPSRSIVSDTRDAGFVPVDLSDAGPVPAETNSPHAIPDAGVRRMDAGEGRDRSLASENALISRAQSAIARGRPEEAIRALREHATRFAEGQFAEEREALYVQALASSGDMDAAQSRAAAFRARFPRSLLRPAVEAALR